MSESTKFTAERLAGSIVVSDDGQKAIKLQLQSRDGDYLNLRFSAELGREILKALGRTIDAAER